MGLDVYVYKCEVPRAEMLRIKKLVEEHDEEVNTTIWDLGDRGYNDLSEEERNEKRDAAKASAKAFAAVEGLTLDKYDDVQLPETKLEEDSKLYPKHMFKVGYFRSSYNNGGINHLLRNSLGDDYDLSYIFDVKDDYEVFPDWQESRKRCVELREKFAEALKKNPGRVTCVTTHRDTPTSEQEALALFGEQYEKNLEQINEAKTNDAGQKLVHFSSYSNAQGLYDFSHLLPDNAVDFDGEKVEPMKVLAIIPGVQESVIAKFLGHEGRLEPCAYVIMKGDNDWYLQALDIVLETIDYVLAQPDPSAYYMHWSG